VDQPYIPGGGISNGYAPRAALPICRSLAESACGVIPIARDNALIGRSPEAGLGVSDPRGINEVGFPDAPGRSRTMDWQENMRISDADFQREVLPHASWSLPAGEIVSVQLEGLGDQGGATSTAGVLDRDAGIDYIIRGPNGVASMAARVSYSSPAYLTFTVGELELEKRRRELQLGDVLGPTYTVQGTITERGTGTFVCGAVTATADLVAFIDEHPDLVQTRRNATTGRPFHVVWIEDLRRLGYDVDVYVAPEVGPIRLGPSQVLII